MQKTFTIAILFLSMVNLYGQEPKWLNHTPNPRNDSYLFWVEKAHSRNINDGRTECLNNLLTDISIANSKEVMTNLKISANTIQVFEDGNLRETITYNTSSNANFGEKHLPIKVNVLDAYYDKKTKECSVLYMVGKNGCAVMDNVTVTGNYGIHGLWRSALLPGWGQFYKGQTVKGVFVSVGFCASAVVGIVAETSRRKAIQFANSTHDTQQIMNYSSIESRMATVRNISLGICAAFYIYNLIDAGVRKGARRVVFNGSGVTMNF